MRILRHDRIISVIGEVVAGRGLQSPCPLRMMRPMNLKGKKKCGQESSLA
jgi:hypothetical protein